MYELSRINQLRIVNGQGANFILKLKSLLILLVIKQLLSVHDMTVHTQYHFDSVHSTYVCTYTSPYLNKNLKYSSDQDNLKKQ
jgi:hypothetical protein